MWNHPVVLAAAAFYGFVILLYAFFIGFAAYEVGRLILSGLCT